MDAPTWDVDFDAPDLGGFVERLQAAAEASTGRKMGLVRETLRRNKQDPGVTIGMHSDGRYTDDDVTVLLYTVGPEEGGELVVTLRPEDGALIVFPSISKHGVPVGAQGYRENIVAVFTPKE